MQRQKSFETTQPTLYLVATPIGNLSEITPRALEVLKSVDIIAAEDTRVTVKLLNHYDIHTPLMSHHEHNLQKAIPKVLGLLAEGQSVAQVSDAGYPAISDPGYELAQAVMQAGYPVVPVSGPNAALDALIVSGIAPQPFLFYGFLSHQDKKKKKELEELKRERATMVFYEAPHRITKTLSLMMDAFGDRRMALCRELTKKHEEIIRGTISEIQEIAGELKGEMVLVVEGSQDEDEGTGITFEGTPAEHVQSYIDKGMSAKDAIKEVARLRGLSKNQVYKEFHES